MRSFPATSRRLRNRRARLALTAAATGIATSAVLTGTSGLSALAAGPTGFTETDLVSDVPHVGHITDAKVKNPWGIALGPDTPLWVANNHTATATIYTGANGHQQVTKSQLQVKLPDSASAQVFNPNASTNPNEFLVKAGHQKRAATFIFSTNTGSIAGWPATDPPVTSITPAVTVPNAKYSGLAMARVNGHDELFAANHSAQATIDVFNSNFHKIGSFSDSSLPGLMPYDVKVFQGKLYVTFEAPDDTMVTPKAAIDVFTLTGHKIKTLTKDAHLSGPWGMAIAPPHWGPFGNDLLVGNEDGGNINAFDPNTGAFQGTLKNGNGMPFEHDGLWSLSFGNGVIGTPRTLIFVAGVDEYQHGLIGTLTPAIR
jgi:uncharacterized protein (TIGR03118 family)